jgi:hypothetical protein
MSRLTLTPSEEDISVLRNDIYMTDIPALSANMTSRITDDAVQILTPKDAVKEASRLMPDEQSEWFMALCLSHSRHLSAVHILHAGHQCPVGVLSPTDELINLMRMVEADTIITIRHHSHPIGMPSLCQVRRMRQLHRNYKTAGLKLRNHISCDSRGWILSWRHWGQAEA